MSRDALVLREVTKDVWQRFAEGHPGSESHADPAVLSAWRRSRELGASLDGPPPEERLIRGEALKVHTESTEIVQHVASTDFDRAVMEVAPRHYVVLLADPSGVVIRTSGGGEFEAEATRVRLIPGADWSEQSRGTNAIGTTLAERRAVYVRGNAHFARSYHDLVCYAAPIYDADGTVVAVLDATSWFTHSDDAVGDAVIRAAGAMTQALRHRALGQAGAAVTRVLDRALDRMDGVALLIEPPARIARMNGGARLLFGDRTGHRVDTVLGVDMSMLVAEARRPRALTLELQGRPHAVRVDPIETPSGKLIALLVFLEPKARALGVHSGEEGRSPAFQEIFANDGRVTTALAWAARMAKGTVPLVLHGETGTGKALFAHAIHAAGPRAEGPLVTLDLVATPRDAQEAALSDALARAAGGTLVVKGLEALTLKAQAPLFGLLEGAAPRRPGVTAPAPEVRFIATTERELSDLMNTRALRQDLYHLLRGGEVTLPPLRSRSDKAALAAHLLERACARSDVTPPRRLSAATLTTLERYSWPGNVRELRAVLEASLFLAGDDALIEPAHLPPDFARGKGEAPRETSARSHDLELAERSTIRRVLAEVNGNVSAAAKRLGVARSTLYRMMRRHGLEQ